MIPDEAAKLFDEAKAIWQLALYSSSVEIGGKHVAYRLVKISQELANLGFDLEDTLPDVSAYIYAYTHYDSCCNGHYCRQN